MSLWSKIYYRAPWKKHYLWKKSCISILLKHILQTGWNQWKVNARYKTKLNLHFLPKKFRVSLSWVKYIYQNMSEISRVQPQGEDVSSKRHMFWFVFSWLILLFSKLSKMADGPNLFNISESAINALKKPEIVKKIIKLKDKVCSWWRNKEYLYRYKGINEYSKSTFIQKWKTE